MKRGMHERQVSRLHVVGSNPSTAAVIDASYRRFLSAMDDLLAAQPHTLGRRPGAGDFALHGQLTQLIGFDPTSRAIAHTVSPRTVAWVDKTEDLCGLDPTEDDWMNIEDSQDGLTALLKEVGRVYVPAQLANARALAAGETSWETEIDGGRWQQQTFPYQAKCLTWTRAQYELLSEVDRRRVDNVMAGTGCEAMLLPDSSLA